jgi:ubiquinone biosynthesis protein
MRDSPRGSNAGIETEGQRGRLRAVLAVLARHGFGAMAQRLGLAPAPQGAGRAGPEALVAALVELGPVAIKLGQLLATRSDLLAPEWIAALATLHDRAPALPFERVEPSLTRALGAPVEHAFATFSRDPIAAASIAQVHAATLHDGRPVVVKIRRPGIAAAIDADLALLRTLAQLAEARIPDLRRYQPEALLDHFASSLTRELDLGAEARAAADLAPFLAEMGVAVPAFEWEWSSRHANVQQRIDGIPATDPVAARAAGVDLGSAARRYARAVVRMILVHGRFHADPHAGNLFFRAPDGIAFIDFGAVEALGAARRDELVRLVLAVARNDSRAVAAQLLAWAGDPPADGAALAAAIDALIDANRARPLADIDLAALFGEIFALLRRFRLALPPDLALMLRTLLIAEGLVRGLDPSFDIAGEIGPVARELLLQRFDPRRMARSARAAAAALAGAGSAAPDFIGAVERVARAGRLPVSVDGGSFAELGAACGAAARGLARAVTGSAVLLAGTAAGLNGLPAGWVAAAAGLGLGLSALVRR